ncbi:MAG: hypothetical protein AB1551_04685 [Actinomycetota bacterium]
MPRKNGRAVEPLAPVRMPQSDAPSWALVPGCDVRRVSGDKPYRCPGCDHVVRPGLWHLVVVPEDDPEARRHWHEACWRTEFRKSRGG